MKKQTGIWIDTSKAILVTLSGEKESIVEVASDIENSIHHKKEGDKGSFMGTSHINNEKKFDERKKHQMNSFVKNILGQIKSSDEFYIFGPAEAKLSLQHEIENDHIQSAKLKLVETADSMTINQVVAKVKDFYFN